MSDHRISWDESFMAHALINSLRSTCIKRHVGAILVKGNRIIASGYNGAPKGISHCTEATCLRLDKHSLEESAHCRGIHAETNCLIQAAVYGVQCSGATIYVTRFPCMSCTKALLNINVEEIIYLEESDMGNEIKLGMLQEAKVRWKKIQVTPFLEHLLQLIEPAKL